MSAKLVIISPSSCSELKVLAASVTIGIDSKGSFVLDGRIALWRKGVGRKTDEPLKPTRPFSSGAGILVTSVAVSQPERSVTTGCHVGLAIQDVFNYVVKLDHFVVDLRS